MSGEVEAVPFKESEMEYLKLLAEELERIHFLENKGRSDSFVQSMINALKRENLEEAKRIYSWDADKLDSYPRTYMWLLNNFGCAIHNVIDCKKQLCSDIRKSIEKDIKK